MDKLVTALQTIFEDYITNSPDSLIGDVKKVFWGNPYRLMLSDTPAIYIDMDGSAIERYSGFDEINVSLQVGYIDQVNNHIGGDSDNVNEIKKSVMEAVEGTDSQGDLKSDSLLGILTSNTTVSYDNGSSTIYLAVDITSYQTEYRESVNQESEIELLEGIVNIVVKVIRNI